MQELFEWRSWMRLDTGSFWSIPWRYWFVSRLVALFYLMIFFPQGATHCQSEMWTARGQIWSNTIRSGCWIMAATTFLLKSPSMTSAAWSNTTTVSTALDWMNGAWETSLKKKKSLLSVADFVNSFLKQWLTNFIINWNRSDPPFDKSLSHVRLSQLAIFFHVKSIKAILKQI